MPLIIYLYVLTDCNCGEPFKVNAWIDQNIPRERPQVSGYRHRLTFLLLPSNGQSY